MSFCLVSRETSSSRSCFLLPSWFPVPRILFHWSPDTRRCCCQGVVARGSRPLIQLNTALTTSLSTARGVKQFNPGVTVSYERVHIRSSTCRYVRCCFKITAWKGPWGLGGKYKIHREEKKICFTFVWYSAVGRGWVTILKSPCPMCVINCEMCQYWDWLRWSRSS